MKRLARHELHRSKLIAQSLSCYRTTDPDTCHEGDGTTDDGTRSVLHLRGGYGLYQGQTVFHHQEE